MNLRKSYVLNALLVMSGVVFLASCERDFNTLGVDLVEDSNFDIKRQVFEVTARNRNLSSVRTDAMPMYQLSDYTDPVFGKSTATIVTQLSLSQVSPAFGDLTPEEEAEAATDDNDSTINENERVTRVYLDIPFFSTANDTLDDENQPVPYDVDSIFGDAEVPVQIKVQEYTKYLRALDPATNFQELQEYFSDEDPSSFLSTILFEGEYTLNFNELLFFDNEDDPDTEDVDESQNVSSRFSPRIRLELDSQFFQERILDKEGDEVLENQELFRDYLRGIFIEMDHPSDNLKMLLNTLEGDITIVYDFDKYNGETEAIEVEKDSFSLTLQGKAINIYNEEVYPQNIADAFTAGDNADRLYLKGESGVTSTVDISGGQDIETFLAEARENEWLINEANLIFYADPQLSGNQDLPKRLYLYDFDNNIVLVDYSIDPIGGIDNLPLSSYLVYNGLLQGEDDDPYYKFRITEHVKSIISNDSTNVNLGLSVTGNILSPAAVTAFDGAGTETVVPQAANYYPYSVVLYGANVPLEDQDKRVRLELIYTEPKN